MRYANIVMSLFCAWVLWQQEKVTYEGRTTSTWEIIGAEEVHEKCSQWAVRAATNLAGSLKGAMQADTVVAVDAMNTILVYKCIPDTVDPRVAKGK